MLIIVKNTAQFNLRQDGEVLNTLVLKPSVLPQSAPNWITKDPLFNLMVKDGSLIQIPTVEQTEQVAVDSAEMATQGNGKKESK